MIGVGAGMAIAGGAAALGSTVSGILNYRNQQNTNTVNKKILREQWAREDNAVQRRKADLIAAGMNPALAADGSGAGAGGTVQMTAPQHPDYGSAVSNAMNIMIQGQQLKGLQADNKLKAEQSALNNQQMLSVAEDIKQKRADLDEHLYNLNKYKEFGLPTNTGEAGKALISIKGLLNSPEFEKIKNTPGGQKLLQATQAIIDGKGMSDNANSDWFESMVKEDKAKRLEDAISKGSLYHRKQASKNRQELQRYKESGQAQIDRERKEQLRRSYWRKGNPWD